MAPDSANNGDDSSPDEDDAQAEDNDQTEQTEITEVEENDVEVVEATDAGLPECSEKINKLTAYAEDIGNGVTYRILPQITRSGANWVIIFYLSRGGQGPILQTQRVTEEQAVDLGLSERQRREVNNLVAQANEELEVPKSLRGQQMDTQHVSALEDALEG